jgi:putative ABC transport system substrate-binding protein
MAPEKTRFNIRPYIFVIAAVFTLIFPGACRERAEILKIGIAATPQRDAVVLKGLREGLADLGYEEGKNCNYIYEYIAVEDEEIIARKLGALLEQDINILFLAGAAGGYVKDSLKRTDIPVIFCGDTDPVGTGRVESLNHPGGNITGVRALNSLPKTMEWLAAIKPGLTTVWMPYDPEDPFSSIDVTEAQNASIDLGIEILFHEVHSVSETINAIESLPSEVGAVFVNPSRILLPGISEIVAAAIDRGLPTASSVESVDTILLVLTADFFNAGEKTARLAHQIFLGTPPSELPIETPGAILTVNLKTAEKIGLTLPNEVLIAADKIIR